MYEVKHPTDDPSTLYDAEYFRTGLGPPYERTSHWTNFFGGIADEIRRSLQPKTVFDAGCAIGMLVECFWDRGIEARGVDISPYAIANIRRDMQPYIYQGSIADPIEGRYDLVTCIEVLEHLPPELTQAAIASITAVTDTILFSSSPFDLSEATHFNVRPLISWVMLFKEAGFWPDCTFDASFLTCQAMLFRRQPPLPEHILALFSERVRLTCALGQRDGQLRNANQELHQLRRESSELQLRHENAINELKREKEQFALNNGQVSQEREQLAAQLSERLAELNQSNREHNHLAAKLADLEKEKVVAANDLDRARREKADWEFKFREQNLKTSAELFQASTQSAALTKELDTLSKDLEHSRQYGVLLSIHAECLRFSQHLHGLVRKLWDFVSFQRSERINKRKDRIAEMRAIGSSEFFDGPWYLATYPDVAQAGIDPLLHYVLYGAREGRNPGPRFDTSWYLSQLRDAASIGMIPLVHYLQVGNREGLSVRPAVPVPNK